VLSASTVLGQVLMTGLSKLVLRGDLEGASVVVVKVHDAQKGQLCYLVSRQACTLTHACKRTSERDAEHLMPHNLIS
jgi:hypothetical protein